jgi:hypothetical protein
MLALPLARFVAFCTWLSTFVVAIAMRAPVFALFRTWWAVLCTRHFAVVVAKHDTATF